MSRRDRREYRVTARPGEIARRALQRAAAKRGDAPLRLRLVGNWPVSCRFEVS